MQEIVAEKLLLSFVYLLAFVSFKFKNFNSLVEVEKKK